MFGNSVESYRTPEKLYKSHSDINELKFRRKEALVQAVDHPKKVKTLTHSRSLDQKSE